MCVGFEFQVLRRTLTHCELGQAVHAFLFPVGRDRGLLGRRLTVQVAVGQRLHRAHPLPDQSHHLQLVDGQVQVLPLDREETHGVTCLSQCPPFTVDVRRCSVVLGLWITDARLHADSAVNSTV